MASALATLQETNTTPLTHTSPFTRSYTEMTTTLQTQPKTLHTHTSHLSKRYKKFTLHWQHYKRHPHPHPHTHLTHHKELPRYDHSTADTTKDPLHTHFKPANEVHKDGLCTGNITRVPHPTLHPSKGVSER